MSAPIDFYFDFSSPYGYMASTRVEAIAERFGRVIAWHPILLGFIFKTTQSRPLAEYPLKGDYSMHDMKRTCRLENIPFSLPAPFPIGTVAAARASLAMAAVDQPRSVQLIHALYRAYFVDGIDISDTQNVLDVAQSVGIERNTLALQLKDEAVKSALKREVDAALARGVFGSPFIIVDDEPFWGFDRLDQVVRWLDTGGW